MNFLPGVLIEGSADRARVRLNSGEDIDVLVDAGALQPGQAVTVGLRPEHAELGTATQYVVRQVQWQERLGESTYIYLQTSVANEPLVVKAPGHTHAEEGQLNAIALSAAALHLFDSQGNALQRRVPASTCGFRSRLDRYATFLTVFTSPSARTTTCCPWGSPTSLAVARGSIRAAGRGGDRQ